MCDYLNDPSNHVGIACCQLWVVCVFIYLFIGWFSLIWARPISQILIQLNAARWVVQPSARPLGRLGAQARLGFWLHGLAAGEDIRISRENAGEDSWGKNGKNAWMQKLWKRRTSPGWPTRCRRRLSNCILVHVLSDTFSFMCFKTAQSGFLDIEVEYFGTYAWPSNVWRHLRQKKHPNRSAVSTRSFKGDGAAATSPCCSCSRLHCSCFMAWIVGVTMNLTFKSIYRTIIQQ